MKTSLLVTTHNRTDLLLKSLRALQQLTMPDQIVIVDDGGTDDCYARVRTLFHSVPAGLVYRWLDNPGVTNCCRARNAGLALCEHEHVIVSEPELLFVSDVVAQFTAARDHELYPDRVLHETSCWHAPHAGASLAECNDVPGFYVHSHMHSWLDEIGGWDESLPGPWAWDDLDLYGRLEHNGHKRFALDEIEVMHQWHPSRIEPAVENEAHVRGKIFPRDLVANRGI